MELPGNRAQGVELLLALTGSATPACLQGGQAMVRVDHQLALLERALVSRDLLALVDDSQFARTGPDKDRLPEHEEIHEAARNTRDGRRRLREDSCRCVTTRESRRSSPDQPLRHALAGRLGQNPVSDAGVPPPRAAGVPRAWHAAGVAVSPPASVSPPADTQAPDNTAGSTAAAENSGRTPCEGSSAAPAGPPWSKHPGLS